MGSGDPWVRKIPLDKETATHSNILAWRIPWTEEPGALQVTKSRTPLKRLDMARMIK